MQSQMRCTVLYLLIGFINNYGNTLSEEESKEIEKTPEIKNHSDKYLPFSHVYVFKYDLNPLVEERNADVSLRQRQSIVAVENGTRLDPSLRSLVIAKQLSSRRKADMKYLENLMAHPTWFTVFTMERPKDFHIFQAKHPVLRNIEKIQQFYRKTFAEAVCMAGKGYQYPPEPYALRYQQTPYLGFNQSNYDNTLYNRDNIRNKIQSRDDYTRTQWFNKPKSSCRNLSNQWIPQQKNITEEYQPQMNYGLKNYKSNLSDLPENVLSFVESPSGIASNIKDIFGKTNNTLNLEYFPVHGATEYVDHSEETI